MSTITFDDFVINEFPEGIGSTGWAYICEECAHKYHISDSLLDEAGGGDPEGDYSPICSVKGCGNISSAYIDIPDSVPEPEHYSGEWTVPLSALQ